MFLWIDGDIIVYSAGSAADERYYDVEGRVFYKKKEAVEYADANDIPHDRIVFRRESNPVEYSLSNVKNILKGIFDSVQPEDGTIYLTAESGNYREDVAVTKPYKGNRPSGGRPIWYNEIRNYLVRAWNAEIIEGREADDAMGCRQWEMWNTGIDTCIASLDKDMNMIPGLHYDWRKGTYNEISLDEADRFFYYQLCIGDSTDNITGIPGIGAKKGNAILDGAGCNAERWERVQAAYGDYFDRKRPEVMEGQRLQYIMEQAHLLWIQRENGVLWKPPLIGDDDG